MEPGEGQRYRKMFRSKFVTWGMAAGLIIILLQKSKRDSIGRQRLLSVPTTTLPQTFGRSLALFLRWSPAISFLSRGKDHILTKMMII